jgi:hypothetical protein
MKYVQEKKLILKFPYTYLHISVHSVHPGTEKCYLLNKEKGYID